MDYKFIHLLYVPTMACNMACKYCYLENNTKDEWNKFDALETLDFAIKKFHESKVIPFNISLLSNFSISTPTPGTYFTHFAFIFFCAKA